MPNLRVHSQPYPGCMAWYSVRPHTMARLRCSVAEKLLETYVKALRHCNAAAAAYAHSVQSGSAKSIGASMTHLEETVRNVKHARSVLRKHANQHGCSVKNHQG